MWLKVVGGIFVVTAGAAMGFQMAWRYGERPRQIRQLISCLSALQSYIYFSAMPLSEALHHSSDGVEGAVSTMFCRAGELLAVHPVLTPEEAFLIAEGEQKRKLTFNKPEQELLQLFWSHLGMMNRDEQAKNLRLIQEQLEKVAHEATAIRDPNMKMYRYLGVCSGLAVVIMLI